MYSNRCEKTPQSSNDLKSYFMKKNKKKSKSRGAGNVPKVYQHWACLDCGVAEESKKIPRCPHCGLRMDAARVISWGGKYD